MTQVKEQCVFSGYLVSKSDGYYEMTLPGLSFISNIRFSNLCIPITWYTIDSPNNVFYFMETGSTNLCTCTFTAGMYDILTFLTQLQLKMTAASTVGNIYSTVLDTSTGLVTIKALGSGVAWAVHYTQATNFLNGMIGFWESVDTYQVTKTAEYVMNLQPVQQILFHSGCIRTLSNNSPGSNLGVSSDVFYQIDVSQLVFPQIFTLQQGIPLEWIKVDNPQLQIFKFNVTDQDGNALKMHGGEISGTLEIVYIPSLKQ